MSNTGPVTDPVDLVACRDYLNPLGNVVYAISGWMELMALDQGHPGDADQIAAAWLLVPDIVAGGVRCGFITEATAERIGAAGLPALSAAYEALRMAWETIIEATGWRLVRHLASELEAHGGDSLDGFPGLRGALAASARSTDATTVAGAVAAICRAGRDAAEAASLAAQT